MSLIVGIVGILLGVLFSWYRGFFWYIGVRWKFEDAEPSKEVLAVNHWTAPLEFLSELSW